MKSIPINKMVLEILLEVIVMRRFEVARKLVDGVPMTRMNVLTGKAEVVYWDITENFMPEYATAISAGADFRAAEDVIVKSMWGQVLKSGWADTTRMFTNSIKEIFGSQNMSVLNSVDEDKARKVMEPTLVHTGIKACMEDDEVLCIYNRSSGPKKLGLVLANGVGVIDADYYNNTSNDGEIMFAFYNFLPCDVRIKKGDKIGQGVFYKFLRAEGAKIGGKREGGFGSTGTDGVGANKEVTKKIDLTKHTIMPEKVDSDGFVNSKGLEGLGGYEYGKKDTI